MSVTLTFANGSHSSLHQAVRLAAVSTTWDESFLFFRRLIPARSDAVAALEDVSEYIAELTVPEGSKHIGKRLGDLSGEADKADVAIIGLIRDGKRRYGQARNAPPQAGDAIVLEATPDALAEFRAATGLAVADAKREEKLRAAGDGVEIIEVVVTDQSRLIGRTAQAVGLSWRQSTVLMGISRGGKRRAFTEHVEKLAGLVSAKTGGEFTMNISYGGLSKNRENLDGIEIGAFEMAQFCAGYHRDKNRVITVLELPFLGVSNLDEEMAVSAAVYAHPAATEEMAQWNAKLLMTSPMPQYNIVGTGEIGRASCRERV